MDVHAHQLAEIVAIDALLSRLDPEPRDVPASPAACTCTTRRIPARASRHSPRSAILRTSPSGRRGTSNRPPPRTLGQARLVGAG